MSIPTANRIIDGIGNRLRSHMIGTKGAQTDGGHTGTTRQLALGNLRRINRIRHR
jgi:hypothetical protein